MVYYQNIVKDSYTDIDNSPENTEAVDSSDNDSVKPKHHFCLKRLVALFFTVLIFFVAYISYNLWNFGTVRIGSYYINAWQPVSSNEPYFHLGKNRRDVALNTLLSDTNYYSEDSDSIKRNQNKLISEVNDKKLHNSENSEEEQNKRVLGVDEFFDVIWPKGWIVEKHLNRTEFQNRNLRVCNSTFWEINELDCVKGTDEEYYQDYDGIVAGEVEILGFCDRFANELNPGPFCTYVNLDDFIKLKDILLPVVVWPEGTSCTPSDMRNTEIAQVINIAELTGIYQKSKKYCHYESYGTSGNEPTIIDYYCPFGFGDKEYIETGKLLHIRFYYYKGSDEAVKEYSNFKQMLSTLSIKR